MKRKGNEYTEGFRDSRGVKLTNIATGQAFVAQEYLDKEKNDLGQIYHLRAEKEGGPDIFAVRTCFYPKFLQKKKEKDLKENKVKPGFWTTVLAENAPITNQESLDKLFEDSVNNPKFGS